MGDSNQLAFIKENARLVKGPILEVGSKDYGNTPDYRRIFPSETYVGIDRFPGKGVDVVFDISKNYEEIISKLKMSTFNAIICFSVLEHALELGKVCSNIERLLGEDGLLLVSVPFCWEYHGFPDDYWRFTPQAIKALFSNIRFIDSLTRMSTSRVGEMKEPDNEFYKLDLSARVGIAKKRYGICTGVAVKLLRSIPIFKRAFDYPYLMPPVLITMAGTKKST